MQQPMKQCAAGALASLGGSCHAAAQPQVTDEGSVIAQNLLEEDTFFSPHPSVLPLVELPPSPHCGFAAGEGFWSASLLPY